MNVELLANTVFPRQYVSGAVYFRRKKMADGRLFVVVNGTGYMFRFGAIK
jgi:hypothetical protein